MSFLIFMEKKRSSQVTITMKQEIALNYNLSERLFIKVSLYLQFAGGLN
ncbi:peptidase [Streptococcus parauberis KRS-02109]|nr:peptidase [Streptococcus parauberis KRS-02109]